MNIKEFESVKNFNYLEYCDYLQNKYGKSQYDYMKKDYTKNEKVTRTKEGLFAHHKYEDHAIMLSNKEHAMNNPFEWQKAENIIYCDYLEHLLLHILICMYPSEDANEFEAVGIGGIINFIVPKLNDFYSGFVVSGWEKNCFDKVKEDKDCYIALVNYFIDCCSNYPLFDYDKVKSSFEERNGGRIIWDASKNEEITSLFNEPVIEFWAHQGGDECLIGFVYDDAYCPHCLNPICLEYEKQQHNTGNSIN